MLLVDRNLKKIEKRDELTENDSLLALLQELLKQLGAFRDFRRRLPIFLQVPHVATSSFGRSGSLLFQHRDGYMLWFLLLLLALSLLAALMLFLLSLGLILGLPRSIFSLVVAFLAVDRFRFSLGGSLFKIIRYNETTQVPISVYIVIAFRARLYLRIITITGFASRLITVLLPVWIVDFLKSNIVNNLAHRKISSARGTPGTTGALITLSHILLNSLIGDLREAFSTGVVTAWNHDSGIDYSVIANRTLYMLVNA